MEFPDLCVTTEQDTEQEWLTRMQAGDTAAFGCLAQLHTPRLHAWLTRWTGSAQEAADLCQETLLRAFRYRSSFRNSPSGHAFRSWLLAIGARVALDSRRKQPLAPLSESTADEEPGPEDVVLRFEDGQRVQRALQQLSERDRAALLLRYAEGMSTAEVAQALEISPGALRVCLHRARARLAQVLEVEHELS